MDRHLTSHAAHPIMQEKDVPGWAVLLATGVVAFTVIGLLKFGYAATGLLLSVAAAQI
ncbi:hypothetical protein [Methylobacterium sp. Gmos1]